MPFDPGAFMGGITAALGGAAAVLGGLATWRKAKTDHRASSATQVEEHMARQDSKIMRLETRLDDRDAREKVLIDYIFMLQLHIVNGDPPPPPPWPPSLLPGGFTVPTSTLRKETQA